MVSRGGVRESVGSRKLPCATVCSAYQLACVAIVRAIVWGAIAAVALACAALSIAGRWRMFGKAGLRGWFALVPVWSDLCAFRVAEAGRGLAVAWLASWLGGFLLSSAGMGIADQSASAGLGVPLSADILLTLSLACAAAACFLALIREFKLSKAFGHGIGMWLALVLVPPVGNMVLGFGPSERIPGEGGL